MKVVVGKDKVLRFDYREYAESSDLEIKIDSIQYLKNSEFHGKTSIFLAYLDNNIFKEHNVVLEFSVEGFFKYCWEQNFKEVENENTIFE